ncbi:hypothetical protein L9Z73_03085 [Pseudomonas sp. TNT11]|uniref:DNA-binding protein n=1 Tax=Pseudomonas emilianonis TaxID=2915812 RepID=A0ABT0ECD1_9PSED|nr:hypothetical protein [Pseudomonas emilianonis]MCK1783377.1 hypothetical protein [Pseudomonas emilianonis]
MTEKLWSMREQRHLVKGVRGTVFELAKHFGIPPKIAQSRISRYGWSIEKAVTEPMREDSRRKPS